ncbi:MAG: YidC/Oxa1 family insertase periplasmic-domain containing protein, partial [Planctomycetota bacterium]
MNFRIILLLIVVGFVAFCGWLVIESGPCENCRPQRGPCILLQQTTATGGKEGAKAAEAEKETFEAAAPAGFGAYDAPATNVTLGSTDPKSNFMFQLELSSKGAAIRSAIFSGWKDRDPNNPQPLQILSPVKLNNGSEVLSMANTGFVFVKQKLQLSLDELHWESLGVEKGADGSQTASFKAVIEVKDTGVPLMKLTKTYKVTPGSYLLDCDLTVENLTDSEQKVRFNLGGPVGLGRESFRGDMRKVFGGFLTSEAEIVSSQKGIQNSFLSRKLGLKDATLKYQQAQSKQIREEAERHLRISHERAGSHFLWAATTNKYFAAILRPVPNEGKDYCDWVKDKKGWFYNPDGDERSNSGDETIGLDLKIASSSLAEAGQANSKRTYNFQLYLGPKDKSLFDKTPLYEKLGFAHTITFMPCFCCPTCLIHPIAFGILALMKWMYGFIPNYGIVIIILVFLFRLAMHPVTKKSQISMRKMTKLGPMAEEIKKKYANNKAEMNKQMMALYKTQGASPIMGFLPMMVQMPIWIALWSAVYASIELRGKGFLPFWITDLSMPDALYRFPTAIIVPLLGWKIESLNLLPLMMGLAFYLQQKLMPHQAGASANPQVAQQQKMMMFMMPLMFPLMLYKAPSGVNLYIMSSTFAGVFEQYFIRKHIRE